MFECFIILSLMALAIWCQLENVKLQEENLRLMLKNDVLEKNIKSLCEMEDAAKRQREQNQ